MKRGEGSNEKAGRRTGVRKYHHGKEYIPRNSMTQEEAQQDELIQLLAFWADANSGRGLGPSPAPSAEEKQIRTVRQSGSDRGLTLGHLSDKKKTDAKSGRG